VAGVLPGELLKEKGKRKKEKRKARGKRHENGIATPMIPDGYAGKQL
jgi:hypothetical protein